MDKRNQTPQHDVSRTRCSTLTFGDRGVMPTTCPGFGCFVHLRYTKASQLQVDQFKFGVLSKVITHLELKVVHLLFDNSYAIV